MTKTTTRTTGVSPPATMAQSSLYQTLRGHLAVLKLDACAEALPRVLDEATTEQLSITATLERLLAIVRESLVAPKPRRPTKPTRASKERRLQGKARDAKTKRLRRELE